MSKKRTGQAEITPHELYQAAVGYYTKTQQLEEEEAAQTRIDAGWRLAANHFFTAMVLGHKQAPYSLSVCFEQGVGVKQDTYMTNLLFGVARQLKDQKCEKTENKLRVIPDSMQPAITQLTQLIEETNQRIPSNKIVSPQTVIDQEVLFNQRIKLPSSDFSGYFAVKEDDNPYYQPNHINIHYEERQELLGGNHHADDDCCCTLF